MFRHINNTATFSMKTIGREQGKPTAISCSGLSFTMGRNRKIQILHVWTISRFVHCHLCVRIMLIFFVLFQFYWIIWKLYNPYTKRQIAKYYQSFISFPCNIREGKYCAKKDRRGITLFKLKKSIEEILRGLPSVWAMRSSNMEISNCNPG